MHRGTFVNARQILTRERRNFLSKPLFLFSLHTKSIHVILILINDVLLLLHVDMLGVWSDQKSQ